MFHIYTNLYIEKLPYYTMEHTKFLCLLWSFSTFIYTVFGIGQVLRWQRDRTGGNELSRNTKSILPEASRITNYSEFPYIQCSISEPYASIWIFNKHIHMKIHWKLSVCRRLRNEMRHGSISHKALRMVTKKFRYLDFFFLQFSNCSIIFVNISFLIWSLPIFSLLSCHKIKGLNTI